MIFQSCRLPTDNLGLNYPSRPCPTLLPSTYTTMTTSQAEQLFSGLIGAEYDMLRVICPAAAEVSHRVGRRVAGWQPAYPVAGPLQAFEIGCGTGITTLALLSSRVDLIVHAVDNEPTMLDQARVHLRDWLESGRLSIEHTDALAGLRNLPSHSLDLVASGYAIHNFLQDYRRAVLAEILRVLKPGGLFVNGDRYGLDDTLEHTRLTQQEVRHWFKGFGELGRLDLLESWVVHLFSDESPDHIMRLGDSLRLMEDLGFQSIAVDYRDGVNTLLAALAP